MSAREVLIHGERFETTEDAALYLSQRLSTRWLVATLIGKTLKAELRDEEDGDNQLIVLSADGQEVNRFPRHTASNKRGVSLQADESMNLIAHIGPYYDNTFLDRGLLWVPAHGKSESSMRVGVHSEHGLDIHGIQAQIDEAFAKGDAFVEGLVEGNPAPPYAQDYQHKSAA